MDAPQLAGDPLAALEAALLACAEHHAELVLVRGGLWSAPPDPTHVEELTELLGRPGLPPLVLEDPGPADREAIRTGLARDLEEWTLPPLPALDLAPLIALEPEEATGSRRGALLLDLTRGGAPILLEVEPRPVLLLAPLAPVDLTASGPDFVALLSEVAPPPGALVILPLAAPPGAGQWRQLSACFQAACLESPASAGRLLEPGPGAPPGPRENTTQEALARALEEQLPELVMMHPQLLELLDSLRRRPPESREAQLEVLEAARVLAREEDHAGP